MEIIISICLCSAIAMIGFLVWSGHRMTAKVLANMETMTKALDPYRAAEMMKTTQVNPAEPAIPREIPLSDVFVNIPEDEHP